jgi:uncharacterized membrane protein
MWPGNWGNFDILFIFWAIVLIAIFWILFRYWKAKKKSEDWKKDLDNHQD